jgi:hypothetical protein
MAARIPMMATTIISSMSVKPFCSVFIRYLREMFSVKARFAAVKACGDINARAVPIFQVAFLSICFIY